MKKILSIIAGALLFSLAGCDSDSGQVDRTSENDYPRIMGDWPGSANYNVNLGETLTIALQFTPSRYTTGIWYVDDTECSRGTTFEFTPEAVGIHDLKLVVKTAKFETSREATITVSAAP